MTPRELDGMQLDTLLEAARLQNLQPSPALLARVMQDACEMQPQPALTPVPRPSMRGGVLMQILALFSGFGAAGAGLATAGLAGIWLGFAQPAPLATPVEAVSAVLQGAGDDAIDGEDADMVELIPSFDGWLAEG
ncbi:hypothetical protein [Gemmobacter serpentinus]|uniref:hypothetical protein n=1 Tax=Gemmobacter serpentinus TaxID=2652247 RepID=UPI00124D4832|nr:hypothetical protein [Gemmobacter serpentinus]